MQIKLSALYITNHVYFSFKSKFFLFILLCSRKGLFTGLVHRRHMYTKLYTVNIVVNT